MATVTPLDYETVLSLEEARYRLEEVEKVVKEVKKKYSGWLSRFKKTIADEDNKLLADCLGVILPLSHQKCVQDEIGTGEFVDTVFARCSDLQMEIMYFLAKFKNTGVTAISVEIRFF